MDTYFTWRGVLKGAGYCIGAVSPLLGLMLFVAVSNAAVTGVSPGHHHESEQSRRDGHHPSPRGVARETHPWWVGRCCLRAS